MGEWIAIDENEVGPLAGFDGTRIMIEMHGAGGNDGGGLYGFEWRESSLDIEFEFAQQAIAGQAGITAWHDGDAGFVQGADHSKGLGRAIFHLLGRGVAAHGAKFDVEHKGRIGDAGLERGYVDFLRMAGHFAPTGCGIDDGVVLEQESDGLLRRR